MIRNNFAGTFIVFLGINLFSSTILGQDLVSTSPDISITAPQAIDSTIKPCEGTVPAFLSLEEMIERVLCHDPQTQLSWANSKIQAAIVGVRQSAYLPRLNDNFGINSGYTENIYDQQQQNSSKGHKRELDNRLNLSLVLFDFGRREAALRNARQLLIAANANQDRQLQETFVLAAQLYYDTLAAQNSQTAASQVAAMAAENLKVAGAKYEAGAAALSDRLQAQVAYSQANLNEVRSIGTLVTAKGLIALRMGLPPQSKIELSGSLNRRPDTQFIKNVDEMLALARKDHPSLIAAKARLLAATAAIDESKAEGKPTLSFVANVTNINTDQAMALNGDNQVRDNSVGLQLNIPLFEGFERRYQIRAANAKLEASEAEYKDIEQSVEIDLWTNYQTLSVETASLERTAQWVEESNQALQVMQGRYRSGVGNMIELLNALTAYANAEQQHITALKSWQMARLKLASSLGRLGFWTIQ